jgi:hypothetical protein
MPSIPRRRLRVDVAGEGPSIAVEAARAVGTRAVGARAEDAGLFDLQLKFNLLPATYAHPSWSENASYLLPEGGPAFNPRSPFWIRRWSEVLLGEWELDRQFDFDFSDPGKRLALLDPQTLGRIGGFAAALLVRDQLLRIIRGADVLSLRRSLGTEPYQYALRRERPLPVMSLPSELCRLSAPWPEPDAWNLRILTVVFSALPSSAAGVIERLRFKFPRNRTSAPTLPLPVTEAARLGLSQLFIAIIHDECPEWAWLFDSRAVSAAVTHREPSL